MVGVLPAHFVNNLYNENMETPIENGERRDISVGSRIRCINSIGTVKYIGEVAGYSGLWYGVDWDDADRGKHDGSVNGVQYFEASKMTSGSFVRPNKIAPSVTCADAIRKHYFEKEDESTSALCKAVIDDWKKQLKVAFIEMVGFDSIHKKQSTLDMLIEASVSDMNVWSAGDLVSLCPSLRTLDISRNLVADWRMVADVASQLHHLEILDLSKNRISLPNSDQEAEQFAPYFPKLKNIVLARCDLEWQHVEKISSMLPRLEILILTYNKISHTVTPRLNSSLNALTELVLDGNLVASWKEILKLGCMKNLTQLSLNECQLKEIRFDDRCQGEKTENFPKLSVLNIKSNLINDWRSVSELEKLSDLQKLYFLKNPLLDGEDYDTCSQFIVARIGNLKELNGSELAKDARRGAEYDYLKKHGKEWKTLDKENKDQTEFLLQHSRFRQLVDKYSLPEDHLLETVVKTNIISSKLIEIILKDDKTGRSFKKKLPLTMSVQKLSSLARRLFASKPGGSMSTEPSLYCVYTSKSNAKEMTVQLDNQLKELDFFSVTDGDTVLVKW